MTTVQIPPEFVKLAGEWHGGQESMLYAVSSTGGLNLGGFRPVHPDEDRAMTDEEWEVHLWEKLASEIREDVEWMAEHPMPDADFDDHPAELSRLRRFLEFAERTAENLRTGAADDYNLIPGDRDPGLFDPDGLPVEECPTCGHFHPAGFEGDCRDDANRFGLPAVFGA